MVRRFVIGVIAVAAFTWWLLPSSAGSVWLLIGMFVAGVVGGALMDSRWSAVIAPVVIGATGQIRYRFIDCPDCPSGERLPILVGVIFLAIVYSIPAVGALLGVLIRGLINDAIRYR
ncbi:MAG: hypothetical protein IT333_07265 [Thermomicrobiales bacterium]|nr:hypothetical protein [Thermomicrobiales bacterium]